MENFKYWFRWISVLSGAIISSLLATFPLHWILYFTLVKGEIISGVNIEPIEYLLYPFIISIIFIYSGYKIAPKYKFKTAIILFILYIVSWLTIVTFSFIKGSLGGITLDFSFRTVLALLGSFLGLFLAKKSDKRIIDELD
jgi:hypothetical protein